MVVSVSDQYDPYVFSQKDLIAQYDKRRLPRRIADLALSFFRQFRYLVSMAYYSLTFKASSDAKPTWNESSQGLVVMLHGLNNHPVHWYKQIQLIKKEPEINTYTPVIKKRGACSLTEAVEPILETILDYTRKHPGKPICLLGVSNGARLTTWIETELRKRARFTPVKVSNISGAHFGSSLLSLGNRLRISPFIVPKAVREELSYGSDQAKKLIADAQKPLPWFHGPRKYEYYATTEDCVVPDLNSTLPKIEKKAEFYVLHGQSHDSIVGAVAKEQIRSCVSWVHDQNHTLRGRLAALISR